MAKRKTGASLFDPENDPAPDVFKVEWKDEKVRVTHYKRIDDRKRCCQVVGQIEDQDRGKGEDPKVVCLTRLQMPCGYR